MIENALEELWAGWLEASLERQYLNLDLRDEKGETMRQRRYFGATEETARAKSLTWK